MIDYNSLCITKIYWHYLANRLRKACFYRWRGPSMLPHWALLLTFGLKEMKQCFITCYHFIKKWMTFIRQSLLKFCAYLYPNHLLFWNKQSRHPTCTNPSHSKYICQNILSSPITNVKVLTYLPNSNSPIFHNIFFYCSNSFVHTYCNFSAGAGVIFHRLSTVTESMKPLVNTTICETRVPVNFLQVLFNFGHTLNLFYIEFNNSTLFVNHIVRHFSTMRVYRDVINVMSRY